ncbi:condensation domain-containing protein [Streptomyces pinistramenti]|uniref:condensation domain-containing protein n=1 Tax=Streptomyces pinistramenti TaxID=2884812 RepID=UPI001D0666D0|nr:condensation domain-containing protein [Streptomyces pinistramenti]MCB5909707.1 condensation domain-containing protein [Streptomyces pinistramenti]
MSESDARVARLSATKRELLARWLAEDAPGSEDGTRPTAPRTEAERTIAGIWQEVLELDRVGIDDDYFALGGDSVHAIVIVAKLELAGLRIIAQDLFDLPTVRALAGRATPDARPLVRPRRPAPTEYPLSPMQEGMLYHSVGGSSPGAYLVQVCCLLTGSLDLAAFRAAWRTVLAASPSLRVSFDWHDRVQARQVVAAEPELTIECLDWRDRDASDRAAALAEFLDRDRAQGFDLTGAPLLRLTLLRESDTTHRCVWTHHHLILDGWSQQLVLADVLACYRALAAGEQPQVPDRPAMSDYVEWVRTRDSATDDAFWADQLAGMTASTRIAGPGCAHGQVIAARRGEVTVTAPADLAAGLEQLCRRDGLTVSTVVYGGWALLLAEMCASKDIVFGVTVSGRPPDLPGAIELVGLLINTVPLRVDCAPDSAVLPWLHAVQRRLAGIREHSHVPLGRVTRGMGLNRGAGLFDTIVVIENFPTAVRQGAEDGLCIGEVRTVVDEGYPLVLEVVPGTELRLLARHDPARLAASDVRALLEALTACLADFVAAPDRPLSGPRALLARRIAQHAEHKRLTGKDRAGRDLLTARRRAIDEE